MNANIFLTILTSVLLGFLSSCVSSPEKEFTYKFPLTKKAPVEALIEDGSISSGENLFRAYRLSGDEKLLERAQIVTKKILADQPDNLEAILLQAKIAETRHQFTETVTLAEKVYSRHPSSKEALYILATSNLALGRISDAAGFADKLAMMFPRTGVLSMRGLIYLSQGREAEGIYELKRAIALEDVGEEMDSSWARCILGRHLLKKGQDSVAEYLFSEGIRIDPTSSLCLDLMGQLSAVKEDYKNADLFFAKAFSVSRQLAHLRHQAEMNHFIGKSQLARDQWSQVEKLIMQEMDSGRTDHRLELIKVLIIRKSSGDLPRALELLRKELGLRKSAELFFLAAIAQKDSGNLKGAEAAILASLQSGVKDPAAHQFYATLLKEKKNQAKALVYEELAEVKSSVKRVRFL